MANVLNRNEFARHKNIRTVVKQRLIAEGRYEDYRTLVGNLQAAGLESSGDMAAWKVAAFPFSPISGGPGEIKADPMYEAIAADWANGKYKDVPIRGFVKFPSGMQNFDKIEGEPATELKEAVKKIKEAPQDWQKFWCAMAAKVGPKKSDVLEEVEWVMTHYLLDPNTIEIEDVPSSAAVGILSWVRMSPSNYAEFLRTYHSKLLPDRRQLEYANRFKDTGQDLALLEEFEESLRMEDNQDAA